jgi:hypothetical protein
MRGCLNTQYEFHPKFDNSVVEFPGKVDGDLIVYSFDSGKCIRLDTLLDVSYIIIIVDSLLYQNACWISNSVDNFIV